MGTERSRNEWLSESQFQEIKAIFQTKVTQVCADHFYKYRKSSPTEAWRNKRRNNNLMGGDKEDIARHFSDISSDRTRGDEHKLKCNKFCLNTRKNFFTVWVVKHWHRLPREALESPSLEIFKTQPDTVLDNLLWLTMLVQGGWTRWPPELNLCSKNSMVPKTEETLLDCSEFKHAVQ